MAKKVCEDWAAILLNEKTSIALDDAKSSEFIQKTLADNDFWTQANALIEKAFYSGTGAIVVRVFGVKTDKNGSIMASNNSAIKLDYISAENIIPLSCENGAITEATFCSDIIEKGKRYIYLEIHTKDSKGGYKIENKYFSYSDGVIEQSELPEDMAETTTGLPVPMFAIVRPNVVNNIPENNGLGISIFANAVDNLKGVDLAYNNLCCDFKLGGKKVFINDVLINHTEDGSKIAPDDTGQQLFCYVGDALMQGDDGKQLLQEFNPVLRVQENVDGIQAQLDYLSFKVGFGTKHYQFNAGSIVTATQYVGDKQELIQNANKHYIAVNSMIISLVRAILYASKLYVGADVEPETNVTIQFDDSIIIDKETERLRDLQEIRDGIMQKWEYRVKWYGEDETAAKKMAGGEQSDDDILGFGGGN